MGKNELKKTLNIKFCVITCQCQVKLQHCVQVCKRRQCSEGNLRVGSANPEFLEGEARSEWIETSVSIYIIYRKAMSGQKFSSIEVHLAKPRFIGVTWDWRGGWITEKATSTWVKWPYHWSPLCDLQAAISPRDLLLLQQLFRAST